MKPDMSRRDNSIRQISNHPKVRVDPDAPLWRYIKLSPLFLNLNGKFFIPTIKQLQESDPKEGLSAISPECIVGQLADHSPETLDAVISSLPQDHQRVIKTTDTRDIAQCRHNSRLVADFWDANESESKCAWCWHCSSHESAAMWRLYAEAGVAIQTNLYRINSSLPKGLSFDAGKIQYCNKETGEIDSINPEAPEIKSVLTRPYFFKSIDYEFEREVRLIIDAETRGHGRLLTDISNEIIDKVVFSPWTKLNEFESLSEIVTRFCPKAVVTRSSLIKDLDDERTESAIQDLLEAQPSRDENVP